MVRILVVDDDETSLQILEHSLHEEGHSLSLISGGEEAISLLTADNHFDLVMLDRKMPGVDGMQVLAFMKEKPELKHIPVIMQTAAADKNEVVEGIEAGVYYYLTKPYSEELVISIVTAALKDQGDMEHASEEVKQHRHAFGMMENALFHFRTMEEARSLAYLVSHCFPDPERSVQGIVELALNAVEHGNLAISYMEKKALMIEGALEQEIRYRLSLPKYRERIASMHIHVKQKETELSIIDRGNGFDYKAYTNINPDRLTDPNGRGIVLFAKPAFDDIDYVGKGNKVVCKVMH